MRVYFIFIGSILLYVSLFFFISPNMFNFIQNVRDTAMTIFLQVTIAMFSKLSAEVDFIFFLVLIFTQFHQGIPNLTFALIGEEGEFLKKSVKLFNNVSCICIFLIIPLCVSCVITIVTYWSAGVEMLQVSNEPSSQRVDDLIICSLFGLALSYCKNFIHF